MRLFLDRFVRAARLDVELYKEVAADPKMLNQAWITVLITVWRRLGNRSMVGAIGANIVMVTALIGWYIWAFFTYFAATRFFRENKTEMTDRNANRHSGDGICQRTRRGSFTGMIPGLQPVPLAGATIWMIIASTIAVKQALNLRAPIVPLPPVSSPGHQRIRSIDSACCIITRLSGLKNPKNKCRQANHQN